MLHDSEIDIDIDIDVAMQLADVALVDDLLGLYSTTVDTHDWSAWLELFGERGSYAVYSLDNVDRGLPLAYMLDDNRARLVDRVKFVTEVWAGTVEPYRTRHVTQRVAMQHLGDNTFRVRSNMLVSYTEVDGPPELLASGYYDDIVEVTEAGLRFSERTVYLDGTPARYLVYPL